MRYRFWITGLATCSAWCLLCLQMRASDDDLPASHAVKPELYATGFAFAEGPALDSQGNLFVVNYRFEGTIGRITPDGEASIWCDLTKVSPVEGRSVQANGIKVDADGRLVAADAGGGRLLRIAAAGNAVEVLADRWEGARFDSINDVALDRDGNIYFTDAGGSTDEKPSGAVYRYDAKTKRTTRLVAGLASPNGIAVSPDQKYLCVAESERYRLLRWNLNAASGSLDSQRILIDFPRQTEGPIQGGEFVPDGLVFDARGRVYVAMWTGGLINVVDIESGKLLRQYDAGGQQATNCHFHGPYLYVTVASKEAVFRLKLGVAGHDYAQHVKPPPTGPAANSGTSVKKPE